MRFLDEFGSLFETFGLARSENEQSAGMFALERAKRAEGKGFFISNNAARHDYGRAPTTPGFGFKRACKRSRGGDFHDEHHAAADANALPQGPHRSGARRSPSDLPPEGREPRKHKPQ